MWNGFCALSAADLALMRRLDELHLEFPFAGSRMLRGLVAAEGCKVGRRKPEPGHKIYPYLLRSLVVRGRR